MPLILEPDRYPSTALEELVRSLREDLEGTLEHVRKPRGRVLDPASLETAETLGRAALAVLDGPAPADPAEWARRANLAYATLLAVIDLVKSHTDVPRVPRGRAASSPAQAGPGAPP